MVERILKKIVRALRKWLKHKFDTVFRKKHYYWSDVNLRKRTLAFYTELSDFEIPLPFYS